MQHHIASWGISNESSAMLRVIAVVFLRTVPIISFSSNQGDKMSGDGFQGANECPDDEKICPTFKADSVITPFIQKQPS